MFAKRKIATTAQKRTRSELEASEKATDAKKDISDVDKDPTESLNGSQKATNETKGREPLEHEVIRASHRMDYQRDLCTQFLKTGRCRYGDSCKFLHERETMATKPPVKRQLKPGLKRQEGCAICSIKDLRDPVKPPCGHNCCEQCFITASKQQLNCTVCGKKVAGSASTADPAVDVY